MFLALKEMARAKVRFGMLIVAIGMLVFLILFQQSLQNGLLTSFVGAIRNQSAPILVYSVDGQRVIQGSIITPDLEALVRSTDGVGEVGRITQGTFTVDAGGERFDTTLLGYDEPDVGAPTELVEGDYPDAPGEAVGSDADADQGFGIGDTVSIQPGGFELTIVGLARDVQLNAGPTLFVQNDDYAAALQSVNPDATSVLPNVLAVSPSEGVSDIEAVDLINARSEELDALTKNDAADETPGVSQVRQSFIIIFFLYGLVVPCVTGLFFLIVTFQKSGALTLLRAIGAPAGRSGVVAAVPGGPDHHRRLHHRARAVRAGVPAPTRWDPAPFRDDSRHRVGRAPVRARHRELAARRPGESSRSTRSRRRPAERTDETGTPRARSTPGQVRHGNTHPDPDRDPSDVPRRAARRAHPLVDRCRASPAGRRDRLLGVVPGVVHPESDRTRDP